MKKTILTLCSIALISFSANAGIHSGNDAPDFVGTNEKGEQLSLSDYSGKYVVLEWLNFGCPFVKKHYRSGQMQALQQELTADNVVWISVISSAPGKQGHMSPKQAQEALKSEKSKASTIILDESGEIGKTYEAVCTPQMYLISPEGTVIYQGAIDNNSSFKLGNPTKTVNYIREAWTAVSNDQTIKTTDTRPYGCSVKY